nr:NS1 [Mute swan feces associated ambidensovirus 2]
MTDNDRLIDRDDRQRVARDLNDYWDDLWRDSGFDRRCPAEKRPSEEPSILEEDCESNSNFSDGGGSSGRHDYVNERVQQLKESLTSSEREVFTSLVARLSRVSKETLGTYISDVIQTDSEEAAHNFSENMREYVRRFNRGFIIVSKHDSHVHVIHDCSYSDGSCRCLWRKKAQSDPTVDIRRPLSRRKRRVPLGGLTFTDWENILLYFSTQGRQIVSANILGQMEKIQNDFETMAKRGLSGCTQKGTLETCHEGNPGDLRRGFSLSEEVQGYGGADGSFHHRKKTRRSLKHNDVFSQVMEFILKYPTSPVINIVDHPKYLESDIAQFRGDNIFVKNAVDVFQKKVMPWTIKDYFDNLYNKEECIPIFSAGHSGIDNVYYDINDSLSVLTKLVEFQCNYDDEAIDYFMTSIYNVLERDIPKCNTILIHSAPSAGKNYFFDCVIDYFINKGQLGRANKHNNFAFQEAYGKRIILWNEPNYESAMTDQLKMMTAGDAYTVTVKNKPDAAVYKTPLIVLTNNRIPLMHDPTFKDRIIQFFWKPAPFLKDYNKKPYPLAIYYMFKNYGLIKD